MKIKENISKQELLQKIIEKKEFSDLPEFDIKKVLILFDKPHRTNEEKIKLSRDLLRKMYSVFASDKILTKKNESVEWFLKKHISTNERFEDYEKIYGRIFQRFQNEKINVIDLGAGINGLSYKFLPVNTNYVGVEAVGQLVSLMNNYFRKEKICGKAFHESLFNLNEITKIISEVKGKRIIFLFKVLDSLEMLERDYSKRILLELMPLSDEIVVSFATRSIIRREKFKANRNWLVSFIHEKFSILDDFDFGSERYICFRKK
jgi:hypothetical protein